MTFVDTSFWYAWIVRDDVRHGDAKVLFPRRVGAGPVITSDRVCEETWTLLRRRRGHRTALTFLDVVTSPGTAVRTHTIGPALAGTAWAWLRDRVEREYSFVDASSFALMRELRITEALAFDGDFFAAGFVELRV